MGRWPMMTTEKKASPIPHAQRTQLLQKTQSNKSWKLYVWHVKEQGKPFAQHTSPPLDDPNERTDNDTLVCQSYAMLSVCTPLQYF